MDRYERWVKKRVAETFLENPELTLREAADLLGCSERILSRIIRECKRDFMLPRVRKTKLTREQIREALDYNERQLQKWHDKLMYGECPNCGETGKDSYLYRKLTEKGYWVTYNVCKRCGTPFGHKISGDVGTDFWRHEQTERFSLLRDFLLKDSKDLQLAKHIVKKIKGREYVPTDQINLVMEWLDKNKGSI